MVTEAQARRITFRSEREVLGVGTHPELGRWRMAGFPKKGLGATTFYSRPIPLDLSQGGRGRASGVLSYTIPDSTLPAGLKTCYAPFSVPYDQLDFPCKKGDSLRGNRYLERGFSNLAESHAWNRRLIVSFNVVAVPDTAEIKISRAARRDALEGLLDFVEATPAQE